MKFGCLVMAAGNASRFGANKLTAALDGEPLIRRTLAAIPAQAFEAVCVVTQYDDVAALAGEHCLLVPPDDGAPSPVALERKKLRVVFPGEEAGVAALRARDGDDDVRLIPLR